MKIDGTASRGFERVAEAFERNFGERGEVGASVALTVGGQKVVDLWGGVADPKTDAPWKKDTVGILDSADLPGAARDYVDLIEQEVGAAVSLISTGPRREETIVREDETLARLTSGRLGRVVEERHGA